VTPAGLGAKAGLDMPALERHRRELPDHRREYLSLRERWASLANEALREANIAARIDHRSLAEQGIDREPMPAIPLMHLKMEQRGVPSELARRLRAEYQQRVQRRQEHALERAGPVHSSGQSQSGTEAVVTHAPEIKDTEEIRRQAREAWLRLRSREPASAGDRAPERGQSAGRTVPEHEAPQTGAHTQDDLSL
jgi:MobA/MobL family